VETIELNQGNIALKLFPNPTTQDVQVTLSETVSGTYEVYDLSGKKLMSGEVSSTFSIPSHTFYPGLYFLKIENHLFKFIKN
jgi:hypothetical protein